MQSNTTVNICIAKRCSYIASLNDMFRPLYRPSSVFTFSYFKANYAIIFFFVNDISCTSIKFAFKRTTVIVELKSYFEIKDINSMKVRCMISGGGGGGLVMVSNWGYSCLTTLVFCGFTVNWLPDSAMIVRLW